MTKASVRPSPKALERLAIQLENPSPRWRRAVASLALEAEALLRGLHLRQPEEAMAVLEAIFRAFLIGKGIRQEEKSRLVYQVMGGLFTLLVNEVRGKHETHYPYLAGALAAMLAVKGFRGKRRPTTRR
ncbi:MAG: hypothetical protein ONB06_05560 [candidate division KSB1 bacterium]|nr:hypothetical protein [candidate division KSB1 bacterium]